MSCRPIDGDVKYNYFSNESERRVVCEQRLNDLSLGIIRSNEAEEILKNDPPGTFLIRSRGDGAVNTISMREVCAITLKLKKAMNENQTCLHAVLKIHKITNEIWIGDSHYFAFDEALGKIFEAPEDRLDKVYLKDSNNQPPLEAGEIWDTRTYNRIFHNINWD